MQAVETPKKTRSKAKPEPEQDTQDLVLKFTCTQADLSQHLSLVGRAVSSRPTHPIMANVLLDVGDGVDLTAFDGDIGIKTGFPADVLVKGSVTLPAKLLSDIISRLPEGQVEIEVAKGEEGAITATITSSSGRYQIRGMEAGEFPELPAVEQDSLSLPALALISGLKSTLFATSDDASKQILNGVHLKLEADSIDFAATDGHRLAVFTAEAEGSKQFAVTVPDKALQELERLLQAKKTEAVTVWFNQSQVEFTWGTNRLIGRLLEGQYPNYRQLIPKQFSRQMTVDRTVLLSSLERIAILADQKNNVVKLSFDAFLNQLTLVCDAADVGSGRETINVEMTGESFEIAFNIKYLISGLRAIQSSQVSMSCNTATTPAVIKPIDGTNALYLLMPVQVRES